MNCKNKNENHICNCSSSAYSQTFDDMEFERGIWHAAQYGDIDKVRKLLSQGVDKTDRAGYTALHHAARAGHVEICKLLISHGASVNACTRSALATPLHRATSTGKLHIVKILIDANADVNMKDADGETSIHRAAKEGHKEIAQYILSHDKKSLSILNRRGQLPIDLANLSRLASDVEFIKLFECL